MRSAAAVLVAAMIVLVTTRAQGATVTYTLVNNWDHDPDAGVSQYAPGRWALYATASQGDNVGMTHWSVALTGWETMQNVSPQAFYVGSFTGGGGFIGLREPPGATIETAANPGAIGFPRAAIDLITPGLLIFGFGQTQGSMTAAAPPGSAVAALLIQDNYGVSVAPIPIDGDSVLNLPLGSLLLARGMAAMHGRVGFVEQSIENIAGVFVDSRPTTASANVVLNTVIAIPEPGTLLLVVIGAALGRYGLG